MAKAKANGAQSAIKKPEILSIFEKNGSAKMQRIDKILLGILVAVYSLIALLNLGTTNFPTSVWHGAAGETLTLDFGQTVTLNEIWYNGNIANGSMTLTGDDGSELSYSEDYGNMFKWHDVSATLTTRYLTLNVNSAVAFNELAFFDAEGTLLSVSVVDPTGEQANLVDEQGTVPDEPSYFNGMYFDEIYHARTAYENIHNMSIYEWTHPPLGKLIIALGILIFGMTPFGWRIMGALFGIGMLPILYVFAKRIFKRTDLAFIATGLFTFDCMHFTQTRIATIDVYAVFFILLMYLFMYEFISQNLFDVPLKKLLPKLFLSGLFFGLGVASKWTGCYAGVGLAVLLFSYLIARGVECVREKKAAAPILQKYSNKSQTPEYLDAKRRYDRVNGYTWKLVEIILWCLLFFAAIPCAIYFAAYTPYYRYAATQQSGYGFKDMVNTLLKNQSDMYNYHSGLDATHQCQSAWYQWPFTAKSVWFYVSSTTSGQISNISSTGNAIVWWVSAVASVCLLIARLTKNVKHDVALWVLLIAILANYLPWVLVTRCVFLYHFFATVPFMILAGVYYFGYLEKRYPKIWWLKWLWLGLAVLYFILIYPAISGLPASKGYAYFLEYFLPGGWLYYGWV